MWICVHCMKCLILENRWEINWLAKDETRKQNTTHLHNQEPPKFPGQKMGKKMGEIFKLCLAVST